MLISEPKLESARCPVCDSTEGVPVGNQADAAHPGSHLCCGSCSTVYSSKRRGDAALAAAYHAEFEDPTALALPISEGALLTSDARFQEVADAWLKGRATHAAALAGIQSGDRVLEIGAGCGETLAYQRQMLQIEPLAVEALESRANVARAARIKTVVSPLTAPNWSFEELDVVQIFHHLQRVPDPLALLRQAWKSLATGGRIVVEVPNVYHPYGQLEATFFRPTDLFAFSESTLTALLRRAGFSVERTVSSLTLFVVGRKDAPNREICPFSEDLLSHPEHNALWVSERLNNYSAMELTRCHILQVGPSMDAVHQLVHQLMKPAFSWHVVDVVLELVEFFMGHQAVGLACLVATAAAEGPYETELTQRLAHLAQVIRRDGTQAVGLREIRADGAPSKALLRETNRQNAKGRTTPLHDSSFASLVDELRRQADPKVALGVIPGLLGFAPRPTPVAQA